MSLYEYECASCTFSLEVEKSIKEYDRSQKYYCPDCGTTLDRILTAPAIHFGAGFFKDGYESAKNVKKSTSDDGE